MTDEPTTTHRSTTSDELAASAGPAVTPEAGSPEARARPGPASSHPGDDAAFERVAIGLAEGRELFVSVGAVGAARADRASVEMGAVGAVAARDASISLAAIGAVAAQEARIEQSFVRTIVAGRVHLGRGSAVAIVLAGRSEGEGRPLLDWRGGLAAGTAIGLILLVGRRLR